MNPSLKGQIITKPACYIILLFLFDCAFSSNYYNTNITVEEQLLIYRENKNGPDILRTSSGAPVYRSESQAINQNILFNQYFMDVFTRFTHERIPERLVHAKGAGAFGFFEVTNDITHICGAKLFSEIGKKTEMVCRFSTIFYERGGFDTARDGRGFACRFYTEEGNFDLLSLGTPIFSIKDPLKFIPFTRVFKRNPQTNIIIDNNMRWDFLAQNPEAIFVYLYLYGDYGIPDGFRALSGYAIHPFQVVNDKGDVSFVKFCWKADWPAANLTSEQAEYVQGKDLDYSTRDLYNAIANGDYPWWKLHIQVMSLDEVKNANFDVFDVTRMWPKHIRKIEVGRMVLNRNPINYFAHIEQLAFSPINLVPGILGGVDPIFQARRFAYIDTQRHRLGSNYNNIHVNCPLMQRRNYIRDGVAPVLDNNVNAPNYYHNSFNGPDVSSRIKPALYQAYVNPEPNNFDQAGEFYEEMSEGERQRLVNNIVSALKDVDDLVVGKVLKIFDKTHKDLSNRVSNALHKIH